MCMPLQLNCISNVKINFEGGDLTSDSGVLLYKEFDEKLGFSQTICDNLSVDDDVDHRDHENYEVIIQRIYQNTLGYHADSAAKELNNDKGLKTILEKDNLASQPTISRANNKLNAENVKQLQQSNFILLDKVYTIQPPEKIILDLDSTNCQTYGDQYGSCYNPHYGAEGYHPLVMFDGVTGDAIKAELRAGNVYTSRGVVRFVGPVFVWYNKRFNDIAIYVRGDSGFAIPKLYEINEEHKVLYTIRLKANEKLYKLAEPIEKKLDEKCEENGYDYQVVYGEFTYKAGSWDQERRVIVKIEKPEGTLKKIGYKYTFIVTNITDWEPKKIVKFYLGRGTMENFIKEAKNGFALGKMSSTEYWVNANKLQQMLLAYNLNNWMRRLCFPEKNKSDRIETVRTKVIKIAAKIVKTGRYIYFKLASCYPYKKLFQKVLNNIQQLEFA